MPGLPNVVPFYAHDTLHIRNLEVYDLKATTFEADTFVEDAEIAGGMTVDGTTLVVDDVHHRVGILTDAPTTDFEVNGNVQIDYELNVASDALTVVNVSAEEDPALYYVGVRTETPLTALDVTGQVRANYGDSEGSCTPLITKGNLAVGDRLTMNFTEGNTNDIAEFGLIRGATSADHQLTMLVDSTYAFYAKGSGVSIPGTLDVTGDTTFDTDTLVVKGGATNRVGVLTDAPTCTLDVGGNTNITGTLDVSGDTTFDTTTLVVKAGTTHKVGVKNDSPTYDLDVTGNVNSTGSYKISGTDALTSTGLGNNIVSSVLTSVGTLSSLNVTGRIKGSTPIYHARSCSSQTLANATNTNFDLETEIYDNGTIGFTWNGSTNRLYNDSGSTICVVGCAWASFAANATGIRYMNLSRNGTQENAIALDAASSGATHIMLPFVAIMANGSYIAIRVQQQSTAPLDVSGNLYLVVMN